VLGVRRGFDLESACAVAGPNDVDDYAVLDLLDALVRKSLLIADRSTGRTRFSMLETIRQFAEEQLVARDEADKVRTAHARHFAQRIEDFMELWDSPRQREAYQWFAAELPNLRTAFRWAADHSDLHVAATIATYAGFFGYLVENYEPIAWAEELVEPARAVDHPRLAFLYVIASQCFAAGRVEDAVRYCDAGQTVLARSRDPLPFGIEGLLGAGYMFIGQPQRWPESCHATLQRRPDAPVLLRACLVIALTYAGRAEEARFAANGLIDAAEATRNPHALSFALLACGVAFRDADPVHALDAFRRGLVLAQDNGNRCTDLAMGLASLEATHGDTASAFDHVTPSIRNYHDSGNTEMMRGPLAVVAVLFDRLGRYDSAATIAGFALSPAVDLVIPELSSAIAHLRDVLGDPTYESLARKGEAMTTAAMATYAYDQIDQARAALEQLP
jgi:hypothetical protein